VLTWVVEKDGFLRKTWESENQELDGYFRNIKELTVSMTELGVRL
jgi:hypothetical protein